MLISADKSFPKSGKSIAFSPFLMQAFYLLSAYSLGFNNLGEIFKQSAQLMVVRTFISQALGFEQHV
jgi:hypothetical protein